MITLEELNSVKYFWDYKRDISRYDPRTGFARELIETYPQIHQAIRDWEKAEREVTAVINAAVANQEEFGQ